MFVRLAQKGNSYNLFSPNGITCRLQDGEHRFERGTQGDPCFFTEDSHPNAMGRKEESMILDYA